MRHIISLLLLSLFFTIVKSQEAGFPYAPATPTQYISLLDQWVNSYYIWNVEPPAGVLEANEELYHKLEADKDRISTSIIDWLKLKSKAKNNKYYSLIASYGDLLWRFGPEYVMKLEPGILQSDDEEIRISGIEILMQPKGSLVTPEIEALVLKVLQRDTSMRVKADAINALGNFNSVSAVPEVSAYLKSEDNEVRKSAVQFFWKNNNIKAVPVLVDMIAKEKNYDVGFWLAWTLCRNKYSKRDILLSSQEAGIRAGVLYFLGNEVFQVSDDEITAVIDRVDIENDLVCRFEMANILAKKGDIRCIPLLISILSNKDNPNHPYSNSDLKTAADSKLACILNLHFQITNEERRQGKDIYSGIAKRYTAWWEENKNKIHWNQDKCEFR